MSPYLSAGLVSAIATAGTCISTVVGLLSAGRRGSPPDLLEWLAYPGALASTWAHPSQGGFQLALFLVGSFAAWGLAGAVIVTAAAMWMRRRPARS